MNEAVATTTGLQQPAQLTGNNGPSHDEQEYNCLSRKVLLSAMRKHLTALSQLTFLVTHRYFERISMLVRPSTATFIRTDISVADHIHKQRGPGCRGSNRPCVYHVTLQGDSVDRLLSSTTLGKVLATLDVIWTLLFTLEMFLKVPSWLGASGLGHDHGREVMHEQMLVGSAYDGFPRQMIFFNSPLRMQLVPCAFL